MPRTLAQAGRYVAASLVVALLTVFFRSETSLAVTTVVLSYLLTVLISSTFLGLGVSVFMSIVATLTLDYFFSLQLAILRFPTRRIG